MRYAAPEVVLGRRYSTKSDMFSFALCLWEMFAVCVPFAGHTPAAASNMMSFHAARPPIPPTWPASLADLLSRAWAADEDARATVGEALRALANVGEAEIAPVEAGKVQLEEASEDGYVRVASLRSSHIRAADSINE